MPITARKHFDEDIVRAENLLSRSDVMESANEPDRLFQDLRLSAVAMAVGAMDAYLCDAYVDCLAKVFLAYARNTWQGKLPAAYRDQKLPAGVVLDASRQHRPLWSIRMAARRLMERDNMLSLSKVPNLFNGIIPSGQKLWGDFVPKLIAQGSKRFTGSLSNADIAALGQQQDKNKAAKDKEKATKKAIATFKSRLSDTVQLRHDWIHNCGRPKQAIAETKSNKASTRVWEVRVFVTELDDHLDQHRLA